MENKSKLNTVLLVIIIILLVVGLVYVFFINSKKNENSLVNNLPQESQDNTENKIESNKSLEIYKSFQAGYEISYPSDWTLVSKSEEVNSSNFQIKNSLDAILPGSNSNMRNNDSLISIQVSYGTLSNGINYTNYLKIDDIIKDSKFGLPQTEVQSRLGKVSSMNIGGKNLRVLKLDSSTGISYSFVYNGKAYNINFMFGSQNQYNTDYKTFTELFSSFVFL